MVYYKYMSDSDDDDDVHITLEGPDPTGENLTDWDELNSQFKKFLGYIGLDTLPEDKAFVIIQLIPVTTQLITIGKQLCYNKHPITTDYYNITNRLLSTVRGIMSDMDNPDYENRNRHYMLNDEEFKELCQGIAECLDKLCTLMDGDEIDGDENMAYICSTAADFIQYFHKIGALVYPEKLRLNPLMDEAITPVHPEGYILPDQLSNTGQLFAYFAGLGMPTIIDKQGNKIPVPLGDKGIRDILQTRVMPIAKKKVREKKINRKVDHIFLYGALSNS